ncbi:MAG TPA: APC family permease [Terriglobales bacterium]|nr:APC family permease [Terriglobales bacterium]
MKPTPVARRGALLQVLGIGFGLAVTVGNTIGTGILRMPGEIAAQLPNSWLFILVWILGGAFALIASFSIAELATMVPRSGGHYVFAHHAFGDYPGFVIGWCDWLGNCGSTAAVALVIGEYSGLLLPALQGHEVLVSVAVVLLFAALQWRGIQLGSRVQQVSTLFKGLGFLVFIVLAFVLAHRVSGSIPRALPSGLALITAVVFALQAVIYAYDGWAGIIYFSEETKNPDRDIPRSLFGGVLSITAIYLLVNAALLYVLPISKLAGNKLAMGTVALSIFGQHGDTIVQLITIVSMMAAINAYQLMMCRIPYSMSVDGLFPRIASRVNQGGTPDISLLLSTVIALAFVLSGGLDRVVAVLAFFFVVDYVFDLVAVFYLRRRDPQAHRPYRTWGYPWTTAIALVAYAAFLVGACVSDTRNSLFALVLLAVSYPGYLLLRRFLAPGKLQQ